MKPCLTVQTFCRLHLGLNSLGHATGRPQFGGVGLMVDVPCVRLRLATANRFSASGPLSERTKRHALRAAEQLPMANLPTLSIKTLAAQQEHTGLGVGTQLGLSTVAGLLEALGVPWRDPIRLAQLAGRGKRSAVGTFGFLLGGLIIDGGHLSTEPLGRLTTRCHVPAEWRFLLVTPPGQAGPAGRNEEHAIAQLPPIPSTITEELEEIATRQIAPSVRNGNFADFSAAVFRYGFLAGKCFAPVQGGTFAQADTAKLVAWLRSQGVVGVGQSSWGPTVFAVTANTSDAEQLREMLTREQDFQQAKMQIGAAANTGVLIETCP